MPAIAIPTRKQAFERLFALLAASSPTRRTPAQEEEIRHQRDICDIAKDEGES
jgi:hypothetical protein